MRATAFVVAISASIICAAVIISIFGRQAPSEGPLLLFQCAENGRTWVQISIRSHADVESGDSIVVTGVDGQRYVVWPSSSTRCFLSVPPPPPVENQKDPTPPKPVDGKQDGRKEGAP